MMYKYRFTVFTCCYNGAHTIHRVIDTLRNQTFKDFEWVILNNASTDNLDEVIESVIKENIFPVKYLHLTPNNFNMAQNIGTDNAEGEFVVLLNADDALTDNALEVFNNTYQSLPDHIKNEVAGVCAHCKDQYGNFIGTQFPVKDSAAYLVAASFELQFKYEKFGSMKTSVLKEFPANTVVDTYIPENVRWFAVASKYKGVYINEILRIYYIYKDSYSHKGVMRHPAGIEFYCEEVINKYLQKMNSGLIDITKWYIRLIMYTLYAKLKISDVIGRLNKPSKQVFAYFFVPVGYLAHTIRRIIKG